MNAIEMFRAIEIVARALGDLRNDVMFVGGAVTSFMVTNPAAPQPRETDDVDIVVDVATYADYVQVNERLRELGFVENVSDGAPTCRWLVQGVTVDVMSAGPQPGPQNRWYAEALEHCQTFEIADDVNVRIISPPYFIATKLAAFNDRGRGDYVPSRDIEDIVAMIDGRASIESEVLSSPTSIRVYLAERFTTLLADPDFVDAVAGHLPGDRASQARLPLVLARLRAIASAASTPRVT